jgi:hypothetical protein
MVARIQGELEKAYDASKKHTFNKEQWQTKEWEEIKVSKEFGPMKDTGI